MNEVAQPAQLIYAELHALARLVLGLLRFAVALRQVLDESERKRLAVQRPARAARLDVGEHQHDQPLQLLVAKSAAGGDVQPDAVARRAAEQWQPRSGKLYRDRLVLAVPGQLLD